MSNGDNMVSEGAPAKPNPYDEGFNAGFAAGMDEMRSAIDGAYNDGFDAGHTAGYNDAQDEQALQRGRKGPPEFEEPFGDEA